MLIVGLVVSGLVLMGLLLVGPILWINWRGWRNFWLMVKLPGPKGMPLLGIPHKLGFLKYQDILPWAHLLFKDYPRICCFHLFGIPVALFNDPIDVKMLLESGLYINKGFEYGALRPWLREGLLVSDGEKWWRRRKLLTSAFHFQILDNSIHRIWWNTEKLVRNLISTSPKAVDIEELISLYTLDVMCDTAMGIQLNAQDNEAEEYVDALKRVTEVVLMCAVQIWFQNKWLFRLTPTGRKFTKDLKILHRFTEQVIESRRTTYRMENNSSEKISDKRKAFLDNLIEVDAKQPGLLTPLDIREEVDTFMFEGHDTTSSAFVHTFYFLANHPHVQEKIYQEQVKIFGKEMRPPTMKELQQMIYLEAAIKETLRLCPSVPYVSRRIDHDLLLDDGLVVPSGTNVGISLFHLHRTGDCWEDPEAFKPERFLGEKERHKFAHIPFSAGPRNCIGQKFAMLEMKTTMSLVVRKCRIEPVTTSVVFLPVVILRTLDPIMVRISPRERLHEDDRENPEVN